MMKCPILSIPTSSKTMFPAGLSLITLDSVVMFSVCDNFLNDWNFPSNYHSTDKLCLGTDPTTIFNLYFVTPLSYTSTCPMILLYWKFTIGWVTTFYFLNILLEHFPLLIGSGPKLLLKFSFHLTIQSLLIIKFIINHLYLHSF